METTKVTIKINCPHCKERIETTLEGELTHNTDEKV